MDLWLQCSVLGIDGSLVRVMHPRDREAGSHTGYASCRLTADSLQNKLKCRRCSSCLFAHSREVLELFYWLMRK